ncbi:unnamed protein product [Caretta caretta]
MVSPEPSFRKTAESLRKNPVCCPHGTEGFRRKAICRRGFFLLYKHRIVHPQLTVMAWSSPDEAENVEVIKAL